MCQYKTATQLLHLQCLYNTRLNPFLSVSRCNRYYLISMRFSYFSVLALSGLSIASPVLTKRANAISLLNDLFDTVQIYTGAISKPLTYYHHRTLLTSLDATLAPLSASSPILEKTAATAEVGAQLNLITAAVTATTEDISGLPRANSTSTKRFVDTGLDAESPIKEKRQLIAVGALLGLIIIEIFATVSAAVAVLGLAGLLVFLNPLTGAISALILAVQLVLDVVLVGVIALLNTLLTALALGVSGL